MFSLLGSVMVLTMGVVANAEANGTTAPAPLLFKRFPTASAADFKSVLAINIVVPQSYRAFDLATFKRDILTLEFLEAILDGEALNTESPLYDDGSVSGALATSAGEGQATLGTEQKQPNQLPTTTDAAHKVGVDFENVDFSNTTLFRQLTDEEKERLQSPSSPYYHGSTVRKILRQQLLDEFVLLEACPFDTRNDDVVQSGGGNFSAAATTELNSSSTVNSTTMSPSDIAAKNQAISNRPPLSSPHTAALWHKHVCFSSANTLPEADGTCGTLVRFSFRPLGYFLIDSESKNHKTGGDLLGRITVPSFVGHQNSESNGAETQAKNKAAVSFLELDRKFLVNSFDWMKMIGQPVPQRVDHENYHLPREVVFFRKTDVSNDTSLGGSERRGGQLASPDSVSAVEVRRRRQQRKQRKSFSSQQLRESLTTSIAFTPSFGPMKGRPLATVAMWGPYADRNYSDFYDGAFKGIEQGAGASRLLEPTTIIIAVFSVIGFFCFVGAAFGCYRYHRCPPADAAGEKKAEQPNNGIVPRAADSQMLHSTGLRFSSTTPASVIKRLLQLSKDGKHKKQNLAASARSMQMRSDTISMPEIVIDSPSEGDATVPAEQESAPMDEGIAAQDAPTELTSQSNTHEPLDNACEFAECEFRETTNPTPQNHLGQTSPQHVGLPKSGDKVTELQFDVQSMSAVATTATTIASSISVGHLQSTPAPAPFHALVPAVPASPPPATLLAARAMGLLDFERSKHVYKSH